MSTSVMLDTETVATSRDAVVLTIGCVKFDPYSTEEPHSGMYCRLEVDEQVARGRIINEETLVWWGKQTAEAQEEAFGDNGDRIPVLTFLTDLNRYLVGADKVWAQGPLFDIIILEDMFSMYGMSPNWRYSQIRDSRTLFDLGDALAKDGNALAHNALADAYSQALSVQALYRQLGVKK